MTHRAVNYQLGTVARVILNRPELNAQNWTLLAEMEQPSTRPSPTRAMSEDLDSFARTPAKDSRFETLPGRLADQDTLEAAISAWTADREAGEAMRSLQRPASRQASSNRPTRPCTTRTSKRARSLPPSCRRRASASTAPRSCAPSSASRTTRSRRSGMRRSPAP